MKKIEIIWRELLYQVLEKGNNRFVQKKLAEKFRFSTSTVFQALKTLRKMGAVRVFGRDFVLSDPEKLLYHWASFRDFKKEIVYQTRVDLPVLEIESSMVAEAIFACFSAYRLRFNEAPADYDAVYVYVKLKSQMSKLPKPFLSAKGPAASTCRRVRFGAGKTTIQMSNLEKFKSRFPQTRGQPNLFVLKADPFLGGYGQITSLGQTFVDLWNLSDWFAKDFIKSLKERIDEILS